MTGEGTVLRAAIVGQWRRVVPASALAMVHQACEALVPVLIGVAVDGAIGRQDPAALTGVLVGFVVLFAALTASMRGGGRLVRRATQGAGHALRVRITERALHPRGVDRDALPTGEVFSISTSDAQRVGMVNAAVWTSAGAVAALVVGAVLLLDASVLLGVVVLAGIVPVVVATSLLSGPLVRRSATEQAAAARAATTATDLLSGLRVLAGLGAETVAAARYAAVSAAARDAGTRAAVLIAVRSGLVTAVTGLFLAVVAVLGGSLAIDGSISVGEFVAALGLTQFLLGPLTRIMTVGAQVSRARASAGRVATLLDAPFAIRPGTVDDAGTALRIHDLRTGVGPPVDLEVAPGESVGVVLGTPGAPEALLAVLGCEAEPPDGRVRLGGTALEALHPDAVRRVLHVARHDAPLFTGSIRDNIAFGADGPDADRRVAAAAHAADADQVAAVVHGGLDAPVGERGRALSGGQRQRVALARALATNAPVLVLHEPTTAVDALTETGIAERLHELRRGRTTILITTSPILLAAADRVVLVDDEHDGGVVEGTHARLSAERPRYRELVLS
ncbi:ABC transporter transmembrane domain-containing protein [Pseudonocardia endophytica]|uniref:Putative ABC transport system ATP-binding protein n=1 Tax=Pseudonocardia endophytica TaxID=401976 RepID=A0A4R1I7W5_PSEEN|nr:ABC transporter ATP-binding protein [Pseudonocardia endophytica]TCK26222.1 putative ABC transport system ATP-binding protein [Pseudonocardia endophytica]